MKTHLTSTQAELDQMKAELEAAVKRDMEVLAWSATAELLTREMSLKIEGQVRDSFFIPKDVMHDAYFKYHEPVSKTPGAMDVWRAAWLAAEASFQEKHKYQLVCCPRCDHEFEYEPDLT
jgi:hypothetical protein